MRFRFGVHSAPLHQLRAGGPAAPFHFSSIPLCSPFSRHPPGPFRFLRLGLRAGISGRTGPHSWALSPGVHCRVPLAPPAIQPGPDMPIAPGNARLSLPRTWRLRLRTLARAGTPPGRLAPPLGHVRRPRSAGIRRWGRSSLPFFRSAQARLARATQRQASRHSGHRQRAGH